MKTLTTRIYFIILIFIFQAFTAPAQKQGNIWYFGFGAGLDFNSGKPVELTDGKVFSIEGSTTISDRNGHLLFYADGLYLWNRKHKVMPSSFPLYGNTSATQSAVAVPLPGDTNIYYLFTLDAQAGPRGMEYTVIDMRSDSGNGDAISRNNLVYAPSCEKITVAPMASDSGYWVITHQYGSDSFAVFKLTARGLNKTPVISKVGPIISSFSDQAIGYLTISPDSKKLAMASSAIGSNLFDFDNKTGKISNNIIIDTNGYDYGVAFSANSRFLYISQNVSFAGSPSPLQQYDLNATNIHTSIYNIPTPDRSRFGGMLLGPDYKIYIARATQKYLDVIQNPNGKGSACNYTNKGFIFNSGESYWGVPNIPTFLYHKEVISTISKCYGDTTYFYTGRNFAADSFSWKIIFPNGKVQHFSNRDTVKEVLKDTGTYKVILQKNNSLNPSLDSISLHIQLTPDVNLGRDTTLCSKTTLLLNAPTGYTTYTWQDGSNGSSFNALQSGKYWVKAQKSNCIKSDTIQVLYGSSDLKSLKTLDTVVCPGFSRDVSHSGCTYLWSDGSTQPLKTFDKEGIYIVKIADPCAAVSDTFQIRIPKLNIHYLGSDTTVCKEAGYTLHATDSFLCVWQDGSTGSSIKVSKAGKYKVTVYRNCAIISDSVNISFYPEIKPFRYIDTAFCEDDSLTINAYVGLGNYLWNDGTKSEKKVLHLAGLYILSFNNQCQSLSDTINIKTDSFCHCYLYTPDIFTPDNNGINDSWKPSSCSHYKLYYLQVYDRWGERVFATDDLNHGWDGNYKGAQALEGMYTFLIKLTDVHNKNSYKSGRFYLIRN